MYLIFFALLASFVSAIIWDFDYDGGDAQANFGCSKFIMMSKQWGTYISTIPTSVGLSQITFVTGKELFSLQPNGTLMAIKTQTGTFVRQAGATFMEGPESKKSMFEAVPVSANIYGLKVVETGQFFSARAGVSTRAAGKLQAFEEFYFMCVYFSWR